ncbi:MAG: hypothetical protein IJJ57_11790, partial [Ruminococcus sp.]|nr:hypothetical protein [Ruminococcus sp.]
ATSFSQETSLSAKIVAFYSGADNGSAIAFHLCTFGALFLHFYFTINIHSCLKMSFLSYKFLLKNVIKFRKPLEIAM